MSVLAEVVCKVIPSLPTPDGVALGRVVEFLEESEYLSLGELASHVVSL